jgi:Tol biopolymer transport system component
MLGVGLAFEPGAVEPDAGRLIAAGSRSIPPQTTIAAPDTTSFFGLTPQFALSPNGERLVFVATAPGGSAALWLRSLSSSTARQLPGTEQATYPFWAPDNQSVGFFAAGKLKKIQIDAAASVVVCDAPAGRGGTWSADDVIVFASGISDPLRKVAAAGGAPSPITAVAPPRENSHRWPQFLPDGRHILFWAGAGTGPAELKVASLDSNDVVTIGAAGSNGAYGAGYLLFGSGTALMAQPFDAKTLTKTGEVVRVDDPVSGDAGSNFVSFAVSPAGTLLYTRGNARPLALTWFDRSGRALGRVGALGQYTNVALSPDGQRLAVSLTAGTPPNRDIWIVDLTTGASSRATSDPAVDATPIWSPDGSQIAFSSQRSGPYQIYRIASTGTSQTEAELLLKGDTANIATDWSPDRRFIVYTHGTAATGTDLWMLRPGDSRGLPVVARSASEDNAVFSPDSQWIAYQSNESGRDEVYVERVGRLEGLFTLLAGREIVNVIPGSAGQRISLNGGTQPLWRGDGKELFFLAPDGTVMSSAFDPAAPQMAPPTPRDLFPAPMSLVLRRAYAVTASGDRFLIPVLDQSNPPVITVRRLPESISK